MISNEDVKKVWVWLSQMKQFLTKQVQVYDTQHKVAMRALRHVELLMAVLNDYVKLRARERKRPIEEVG